MKIKLLCVGAVRDNSIAAAIDMYAKRIPHYWPFSMVCIPDVRGARDPKGQKALEGAKILAETAPGDFLMLLDERGKQYTSRQWADFLQRKSVELPRSLVLAVGGPYGFSPEVYDRSDAMISLWRCRMDMTPLWARAVHPCLAEKSSVFRLPVPC